MFKVQDLAPWTTEGQRVCLNNTNLIIIEDEWEVPIAMREGLEDA